MRRVRLLGLVTSAVALVVVMAACSSTPQGSLMVTISGLPAGVAGSVEVTGPGGYAQSVTSTTTLTVAPGTYSITVAPASNGNAIVATLYDGSASPPSVSVADNGSSTTAVAYAMRPGSGAVWVPMKGGGPLAVEGFTSATLATAGSTGPDIGITGNNDGEAIAFDGAGNLWVSQFGGMLYHYDASQLASSGTPTPSLSIDASSYGNLSGLAFDAAGDLWVAVGIGNKLLQFTPAQLAAGGTPTPPVVISATPGGSLLTPIGMAFDPAGNLWVANHGGVSLVKFAASQLAASGSPTPAVTITNGLSNPFGIAFDASGNLWVADSAAGALRYDAADLGSASASPAAAITGAALPGGPEALAFDASGALWVAEHSTEDLRQFTNPGAWTGTVTPAADVIISSVGMTDVGMLAFSPSSSALPIQAP